MNTTIKVNWYKESGKWYAQEILTVDSAFICDYDSLRRLIINEQTQLGAAWVHNNYFVSVSAEYQPPEDTRFFEHLYKFNV